MLNGFNGGVCVAALTAVILASGGRQAHAGAFGLDAYSAAGVGAANAGAAAGAAGLGSIAWNPATMSDFAGFQTSSTGTWIDPSGKISPSPITTLTYGAIGGSTAQTGDIGDGGRFVPATQLSYQFNDRLWLGLTVDAPFGLSTIIRPNAAASYYGTTTQAVDVNFTPMAAYRIADWLTFGAGLQVEYFSVRLGNQMSPLVPRSTLAVDGDGWGVGYRLGATIKPTPGTEVGLSYRSTVREDISGHFFSSLPFTGMSGPILPGAQNISSTVTLPDQFNLGLHQEVTDRLGAGLSYEWTHWSIFNRFIVQGAMGPLVPLSFQYQDGWLITGGVDYKVLSNAILRAGLGYESSPINDVNRTVRLPDQDRFILAVGAGYQATSQITIDLAFSHYFMRDASINITSSANPAYTGLPFVGTSSGQINVVSGALTYKFDAPKPVNIAAKY